LRGSCPRGLMHLTARVAANSGSRQSRGSANASPWSAAAFTRAWVSLLPGEFYLHSPPTRSRTKQEQCMGPRYDQRSQRQSKPQEWPPQPWSEDARGQGALIAQRDAAWLEPPRRPRSRIRGLDRRLGARHCRAAGRQGPLRNGVPDRLRAGRCVARATRTRRLPCRGAPG
jgi:hypothetical protein